VTPSSLVEVYRRFSNACYLSILPARMMEAVSTTDTSVHFYQTSRRHIPEYISYKVVAR